MKVIVSKLWLIFHPELFLSDLEIIERRLTKSNKLVKSSEKIIRWKMGMYSILDLVINSIKGADECLCMELPV